jgi:uncharacterized membrane protein
MNPDLSTLSISAREVEHLTNLEIGNLFVARTYRPSVLIKPQGLWRFGLAQLLAIGLTTMVSVLPVSAVLDRDSPATRTTKIPLYCGSISLLILAGGNYYLWQRQQRVRVLLRLLDEVDRFNQVVQSAVLLQQLATVSTASHPAEDLDRVLQLTRQNLLASLQIDRLLRNSQGMHYGLWRDMEANLAHLQQIDGGAVGDEYGRLLAQAGQIGLDVYREMQPNL